jgi:hypothetical protein
MPYNVQVIQNGLFFSVINLIEEKVAEGENFSFF